MFKISPLRQAHPRFGLIMAALGLALFLTSLLTMIVAAPVWAAAPGQDSYPGPVATQEAQPETDAAVEAESYPGPAQGNPETQVESDSAAPTAYPAPAQPTTGPGTSGETGRDAPAIATPVPMPQVPEAAGSSRISLLLVGLVLLGLVVVVVLIAMRRR